MGIIACGVRPVANGNSRNHMAIAGIDDSHHRVVADGEQAMMHSINAEATWRFARRQRPGGGHLQRVGIDAGQLTFVFDVDEYVAGAVGLGELRFAGQRDGRENAVAAGVNRRGRMTAAIEREDATGEGRRRGSHPGFAAPG